MEGHGQQQGSPRPAVIPEQPAEETPPASESANPYSTPINQSANHSIPSANPSDAAGRPMTNLGLRRALARIPGGVNARIDALVSGRAFELLGNIPTFASASASSSSPNLRPLGVPVDTQNTDELFDGAAWMMDTEAPHHLHGSSMVVDAAEPQMVIADGENGRHVMRRSTSWDATGQVSSLSRSSSSVNMILPTRADRHSCDSGDDVPMNSVISGRVNMGYSDCSPQDGRSRSMSPASGTHDTPDGVETLLAADDDVDSDGEDDDRGGIERGGDRNCHINNEPHGGHSRSRTGEAIASTTTTTTTTTTNTNVDVDVARKEASSFSHGRAGCVQIEAPHPPRSAGASAPATTGRHSVSSTGADSSMSTAGRDRPRRASRSSSDGNGAGGSGSGSGSGIGIGIGGGSGGQESVFTGEGTTSSSNGSGSNHAGVGASNTSPSAGPISPPRPRAGSRSGSGGGGSGSGSGSGSGHPMSKSPAMVPRGFPVDLPRDFGLPHESRGQTITLMLPEVEHHAHDGSRAESTSGLSRSSRASRSSLISRASSSYGPFPEGSEEVLSEAEAVARATVARAPSDTSLTSLASASRDGGDFPDLTCVICHDNVPDAHFNPCGHICTCVTCAIQLVAKHPLCPLCRTAITHIVKGRFGRSTFVPVTGPGAPPGLHGSTDDLPTIRPDALTESSPLPREVTAMWSVLDLMARNPSSEPIAAAGVAVVRVLLRAEPARDSINANAVRVFVRALHSCPGNVEVARGVCACLRNIAWHDPLRAMCVSEGGADAVLHALRSHGGDDEIDVQGVSALVNMSLDPGCRDRIIRTQGVSTTIREIVGNTSNPFVTTVAICLALSFAESPAFVDECVESAVASNITIALTRFPNEAVLCYKGITALRALIRLNRACADEFVTAGGPWIVTRVSGIHAQYPEISTLASQLIADVAMATDPNNNDVGNGDDHSRG